MIADQLQRLGEIAADLERGQAAQPLSEALHEAMREFGQLRRAILIRIVAAPAFPVPIPAAAALRPLPAAGAADWEWLQVVHAGHALNDLGNWNRLVGFSPLVVVSVEQPDATSIASFAPLWEAFAVARKRCVVLSATDLPRGLLPPLLPPALRVATFTPEADWTRDLPALASAEWRQAYEAWLEAFAAERAAQPLLAKLDLLRQRTQLHRAVNEQRQAAMMLQRDSGQMRASLDKARDACLLTIETAEKELADNSRLFLAANGEGMAQLKSVVDKFGADSVREEVRPKVIILTLDESELKRLVQQIEAIFWAYGKKVATRVDQRLAEAFTDFGRELRQVIPDAAAPTSEPFVHEKLRKGLAATLHTNLSYRGELPVKGFFERIQASRQIVFLLVGLLSLVGASAIARNPWVILGTLAIFSVMLFKTSRDFRQEAVELREREMDRLLETMRTQMRQQLMDLETMRLALWRDHLQAQRRAIIGALDQATRDSATRQLREMEDERQKIQLKQKALDKAQRDLLALDQRLQALLNPLRTARLKAEQTIATSLRP
jgi:hypothetical protein